MECKKPDTIENKMAESLIAVEKIHRLALEKYLNKTGVYRSQHQILMCLSWNPDISQKDLAKIYHVSTAAVAVSLKKLEKGGYIEREVNTDDNRYHKIHLSKKGLQVTENSKRVFRQVEEAMVAGFSEEEKWEFFGYMERLKGNLTKMLSEIEKKE